MAGYGDDTGFNAWLATYGYELPATLPDGSDMPSVAVLRERGSNYIDNTYGALFIGTPTDPLQERAWPRTDAYIFGTLLSNSVIPARVVTASYHAAYIAATNPSALSATLDPNSRVKRERVEGAVEMEYFEPGENVNGITASLNSDIEGLLAPLLWRLDPLPMVLVV